MADSLNSPLPENLQTASQGESPWSPLGEPLFRSLWIAAVISYTGTWMQNVGAGWLMTQLTMSPLMVGLVQAATTLPVFLVIIPAGALADMVDRRRFLLITQGWMVMASAALGVLSLMHHITPWVLLGFTFILGLGAVMNDPAWQAITPEIVSRKRHASAVALNSVGFNVARAVGPALGGMVIAATNSGVAFLLNALSFFGVIFFLYRWRRPAIEHVETGHVMAAIHTGIRYGLGAPVVRCVLIRTGAFSLAASSLLALLPILARPHGPTGYGLLLGSFGLGALAGAAALPRLRNRLSVDGVVAVAIVIFAVMTFAAGRVQTFSWLCLVLFTSGTAWIGILACLNVAAQTMSPPWLRARALSLYLLVLQGGMAIGSAAWGALATKVGIPWTLFCSAIALIAGLFTVKRFRLSERELDLASSMIRD
ncbi:MAG: MFS transporter [Terriglobales bacterium]|jgi:MFS family permease|nr:MFS transporter [Terriglobales bacterium]